MSMISREVSKWLEVSSLDGLYDLDFSELTHV